MDNWILFFVVTATLCAISTLIPMGTAGAWVAPVLWSLFAASGVGFLWILDSFRDLEDGILERIEIVKTEQAFAQIQKDSDEAMKSSKV